MGSAAIPGTEAAVKLILAASLVLWAATLRAADPSATLTFKTVRLDQAVMSLPAHWPTLEADLTLWLHLHGAPAVVETNFAAIGAPGVLVNVTLPGLSNVYADHFADARRFGRLLTDVEAALQGESSAKPWRVGRVVVSSFSAGFGGVRQLLRQPAAFARIDALVMADSIYCGYAGDVASKQIDAELMAGFLRFARLANERKKQFVVSHSRQVPEGYASTTETADYLIAQLGLSRQDAGTETWPGGLRLLSRCERGGFQVLGFDGAAPEDHMLHLRDLGALLRRVRPTAEGR